LGTGIEFKRLGLVIIDEEQKFGVKQKEMLKRLRTEVDVLSMSATPIPRTLSMALMNIRQMSLINDPPPGRLAVRTVVRAQSDEVVKEAILRELSRGGQVFYVYNRVQSINRVAQKLQKLVPTARIGIGHGQMSEEQLEPIMVGFVRGEIDILVSTTIVESGIDIPNANTLIVENADRLGLGQLYQLRGRVGRSDRQAYALFMYSKELVDSTVKVADLGGYMRPESTPKRKPTGSENAFARLQALQEFSSLGAGYSLAFRDLQIRGAGELLGAKQSGTMVQVGYELYSQLISEAVASLKHSVDGDDDALEAVRDPLEATAPLPIFEIPVLAMLPDSYIPDQSQRLYYYQQMMSAKEKASLDEVFAEIEDRYGRAPLPVRNAHSIMQLRIKGRDLGLSKLECKGGRIAASFRNAQEIPPRTFVLIPQRYRAAYRSNETLIWPFSGDPIDAVAHLIVTVTECIDEITNSRINYT
jgi:transcription-repair coupling factor (superfamily II helicase)